MTFRELMQIEQYICEIESLKNLNINGNELKIKVDTLNKQISSCVKEYEPQGIDWNNAWAGGYASGGYVVERVKNILTIMQAALQGILNRLPYYDEVCDLTKDISYGRNISNDKKRKVEFIVEKINKYSSNIKFEQSVVAARDKILMGNELNEEQIDSVFNTILVDIEDYRNSLCREKRDLKEVVNTPVLVQVEQTQNNTQTQYSITDISLSIENCFKNLDDCESVNEEEIEEIKRQLKEVQELLKYKKGKRKPIREKIKSMLKWVADKGTDAMIALLPTIVAILTNLQVG